MACPMCWLGAWLRRKLKVNSRTARAERAAHAERIQLARRNSYNRRDALPPPYPRPPPASTETLDTLRARNPPSPFTNRAEDAIIPPPPPPTGTLLEACQAAARNVGLGLISAICEDDREMVAARILRTIATSVST
ncbi:hypothetical protein J7T55_005566 [Diaporthe amygdali]|uniref:uncharacterized protein n=1 Tax=Phomopsis amygdali TaxID=1214568 RepID=UPI0022FF2668|nr:uncharacterized protein J7T55_005566 [Diaporthe amygdali]KAJ0124228.1 hypothetical protein J7T55_005566 [Diaporthe amygdali]